MKTSSHSSYYRSICLPAFRSLLLCLSLLNGNAYGATTSVSATLDTNQIRIGEQFNIRLTAVPENGATINFPIIPDTLNGLEIVERGKIDTLKGGTGNTVTLRQLLAVTGFDSGYFVIEPFLFTVKYPDGKTDSLATEAQLISVKTIPVDTTKAIKDIKPVMDPPFDWMELLPWLWVVLALGIVSYIGYRLYRRFRQRGAVEPDVRKPSRPAHEIALEAIEKLEKEKLWQQGYHKEYHIRLTDIVRMYIEQRFGVASQESTTDETVQLLRGHSIDKNLLADLERMLRLADLVKFAKAVPIINENEQSLSDARSFIVTTAVKQQQEEQA